MVYTFTLKVLARLRETRKYSDKMMMSMHQLVSNMSDII